VCHIFCVNRKTGVGKHLSVPLVKAAASGREAADEVGPGCRGAAQRLISLPASDGLVVPGQ
jgi:hypothetical protein